MENATVTSDPAAPPDPAAPSLPDQDGRTIPARIAEILSIVAILAAYGRHLLDTLERRAAARSFGTIAQFFGTAAIAVIRERLLRGIMRAVALQRMLEARAARGIDLKFLAPRRYRRRAARPASGVAPDGVEAVAEAVPGVSVAVTEAGAGAALCASGLAEQYGGGGASSMAQIEAEVRRRPVGQTIVDICRDLGVSPALCSGEMWNRLFDAIRCYRGSFGNVLLEMRRREKRFDQEQGRNPGLALPEFAREGMRRVLGFFIGEPMVDPFSAEAAVPMPVAAAATGPP